MRAVICCASIAAALGPAASGRGASAPAEVGSAVRRLIVGADLLIAADGGARLASAAGRRPDLLVGDLDSLDESEADVLAREGTEIVRVSIAKDETDGELALREALARAATEVVLVGASAGRLDHALANVGLLVAASRRGAAAWMVDEGLEVYYLEPDGPMPTLRLSDRVGSLLSLIPFGADYAVVSARGVRWPLSDERLDLTTTRGVSNVVTETDARVDIRAGGLAVVSLAAGYTGVAASG